MNLAEKIELVDSFKMFEHLKAFPNQILKSLEISEKAPIFRNNNKKFCILGIGGSAIAGDLLQSYFRNSNYDNVEIFVNRNYILTKNIDNQTNVIVSSYSGDTEETIEAYNIAKRYTKNIIGITSGGKLAEILPNEGYEIILIPGGLQPREALGYSFFTLMLVLTKSFENDFEKKQLKTKLINLFHFLKKKAEEYSNLEANQALELANDIQNKLVLIYSCEETLSSVATRFKAQLQENAKQLAFASVLPEMNHNEINSFINPKDLIPRIVAIFLKDVNDYPKNQKRIEATFSILSENVFTKILKSEEKDFLFRMFDLLYLLDWVSFYSAILNGIDPTPIPIIKKLKTFIQS